MSWTDPRDLFVHDVWSPLSFKRLLGERRFAPGTQIEPSWVGDHRRRLRAYQILAAYYDNVGREFRNELDPRVREQTREYGDAALLVDQVLSALLGDCQEIVTDGAADYDEHDDAPDAEAKQAHNLQEWLSDWWDQECGPTALLAVEEDAVKLGDGVYVLGWNTTKNRVRLRVFDPGFYFPVLDDDQNDDFPTRIHIAWEIPGPNPGRFQVRRITWELGPINPDNPAQTRTYPWDDKPSNLTCYLTDGTWQVDLTKKTNLDLFQLTEAQITVDSDGPVLNRDLRIDFLPVVHVPNTPARHQHYGRALLSGVAQILDDLHSTDTDLQAAAATTAKPPVWLKGARLGVNPKTGQDERLSYVPGEVIELPPDGELGIVDTSRSLDAMSKFLDLLQQRLFVSARVPESVLGRVKASEVASGVALALSFGPLTSLIGKMRLSRNEKYPLLFRFAQRIAQAAGDPDVPDVQLRTELRLGNYLPEDRTGLVSEVIKLVAAKLLSPQTAMNIISAAGFTIDDVTEELERIDERDFAGAIQLLEATGDEQAVFDYLQRDPPPPEPEPPAPPPGQPQPINPYDQINMPAVQPPPTLPPKKGKPQPPRQ